MSDATRRESDRISSLWREAIAAIRCQETVRLTARWLFPVSSDPIENGLLVIEDGIIEAVEPLAGRSCPDAVDFGNSAIIPALVNAHAHLEFSDLAEPIQPSAPFLSWIRNLIAHRNGRCESTSTLAARGAAQSGQLGTTIVGDIVTGDWSPESIRTAGSQVVAYRELIGLLPEQLDPQLKIARDHLWECGQASIKPALSPHASFSVSPELFHSLVELAKQYSVPLCIHLAETKAELELLKSSTGELVEMLTQFGIWQDGLIPRRSRPMDYLEPLADLPAASIAHGNYLSDEDISFLGDRPNITTVFCPRTHHFFGHDAHPWQRLIEAGASVALGTDGRCSSPDYSLWAELQFLDRATNGSRRPVLLEMATRQGAKALGVATAVGALEHGQCAEPVLVQFGECPSNDPWDLLFDPAAQPEPAVALR